VREMRGRYRGVEIKYSMVRYTPQTRIPQCAQGGGTAATEEINLPSPTIGPNAPESQAKPRKMKKGGILFLGENASSVQ